MSVPGAIGRPAYSIYRAAWTGLDWLYPPHCGGCGQPGSRWCAACQAQVHLVTGRLCPRCGEPARGRGLCPGCDQSPPPFTALRSWAVFDGNLRNAVHRLKYKGDLALGEVLARPLIHLLQDLCWQIDRIAPVPLGLARRKERGYNQAALLAWPLALGSGIKFVPGSLKKERETRPQVGLSAAQRRENVAGAFVAAPERVAGKVVLVVDDVTTTGATISACAQALLDAGAREVYGLTLTRAAFQHTPGPSP